MKPPVRPPVKAHALRRRQFALGAFAAIATSVARRARAAAQHPNRKWYEAADSMRRLALSWGDQAYGAVVVAEGQLLGEGPSRVIQKANPDAHAEREAIQDAQRRFGRQDLSGAVLYSTSRPCRLCEEAAARAKLSRMYFGPDLIRRRPAEAVAMESMPDTRARTSGSKGRLPRTSAATRSASTSAPSAEASRTGAR